MHCEFEITDQEYIQLCDLLKSVGACQTGGHAKLEINEERVLVDGQIETRKRCKIRKGQTVEFEEYKIDVV